MPIENGPIGIIDSGMGNILSVLNALIYLGAEVRVCKSADDLNGVERIVFPGVGSFDHCMERMHLSGLYVALKEKVEVEKVPIMGICLGMQVMASKGTEGKDETGFGWIEGDVVRMDRKYPGMPVPHMGWNDIEYLSNCLFQGLPPNPDVYFVHSYQLETLDPGCVVATTEYESRRIIAAVLKDNVFGTQFHPEKSQEYGLQILSNFLKWKM